MVALEQSATYKDSGLGIVITTEGNEEAVSICKDARINLISATGSTQMGKELAPIVSARLGKLLLELGGNNAAIVCPSADLDLTIKGIAFSACGTTGQRCKSNSLKSSPNKSEIGSKPDNSAENLKSIRFGRLQNKWSLKCWFS